MTSTPASLGRSSGAPIPLIAFACLAALAGIAIAMDSSFKLVQFGVTIVLGGAWTLWATIRWRLTAYFLFFMLPFAILPGLAFGAQGWPTLLKDVLFILPLYAGAFIAYWRSPRLLSLPPPVLKLLTTLVVLVLLQTLVATVNAGFLVALVGLKVWLWYVPLILLPRLIFRQPEHVLRWLRLIVLLAIIPSVLGIIEAYFIYSGRSDVVYSLYGPLASSVTQEFAQLGLSEDLIIRRIPSTFTFVAQYYIYLITMFPLAVAAFFGARELRWRFLLGLAVIVIAAAGITSGARGFLAWLPVQVLLLIVLGNRLRWWLLFFAMIGLAGLAIVAGGVLGSASKGIYGLVGDYLGFVFLDQWTAAVRAGGVFGAGVGTATNAARYVLGDSPSGAPSLEVWYAKAVYEIGVPGIVVILLLWAVLLYELWVARRRTLDPPLQSLSGGIVVAFVTSIANLYKGTYIDLDPLNVYFWFLIGLGLALPSIGGRLMQHKPQRIRNSAQMRH